MNEDEILKICKRVVNNRNIIVAKWVKENLELQKDNNK
jgi:hypothetical protein